MSTPYTTKAQQLGAIIIHNQSTNASTWLDESGSGLDGTLSNAPTWNSTGGPAVNVSGYFHFDGVDQSIEMGNPAALQIDETTPVSFVYWIKRDATDQPVYTQIIGKGNAPGFQVIRHSATSGVSGQLNFDLQFTTWAITGTTEFTPNEWQMYMSRFTGTTIEIWKMVNGSASLVATHTPSGGETTNSIGTSQFVYAAQDRTETSETRRRFWRGDMAGVLTFDSSLSTTNFEELYSSATTASSTILYPGSTISSSGIVDQAAGTSNLELAVEEETTDNDTTYLVNSARSSGEVVFSLTDTPANFGQFTLLEMNIRARKE